MHSIVVSKKKYIAIDPADEFDRMAKSILSDILAANPWIERFCGGASLSLSGKHHNPKNLAVGYAFLRGLNLMSVNPHVKICTHIKVTGVPCGSPALSGQKFCYFHQRMIRGVPTPKHSRIHPMALLESEEAIQVALMETINALVRNHIDLRRAELIIKALNVAVKNASRVHFNWSVSDTVRKLPQAEPDAPVANSLAAPTAAVPAPSEPALPSMAETAPLVPRKPPARAGDATFPFAASAAKGRQLKE